MDKILDLFDEKKLFYFNWELNYVFYKYKLKKYQVGFVSCLTHPDKLLLELQISADIVSFSWILIKG